MVCLCALSQGTLASSQRQAWVRLTGNSKLATSINVSKIGCLCLCISSAMDWAPTPGMLAASVLTS